MSAFEISLTPSRLKQKKRVEGREPTFVMMAPFSAKAIVQFEDVPITKTAKRMVRVVNPSEEDIEVKVIKAIRPEYNLTVEWTERLVPAGNEVTMELVWNPQLVVTCTETLQLLDNRNFRKDVMIILKSKSNQVVKNTRKFPTVGKTLQLKSPTGGLKVHKNAMSLAAVQQKKRLSTTGAGAKAAANGTSARQPWRNVPTPKSSTARSSKDSQAPLHEHNIYATQAKPHLCASPESPGYKENVSPNESSNGFNLIDKLKFTPLNETHGAHTHMSDNLAAWPTPNHCVETIDTKFEMRPRRLTDADLVAADEEPCILAAHIVTNKTFDIKHAETFNFSTDSLDCSRTELLLQTPTATLNRTTTITHAAYTRPLECIREEDGNSTGNSQEAAHPKTRTPNRTRLQNLKRDVELVGSPLRKYSESMKDLSLVSPQTKLAIQGSMPNLNEMAQIRSIEQNRYYQQQPPPPYPGTTVQPQQLKPKKLDNSMCNETSASQHDLLFNQHEILAQSSRFNLHEIESKSRKGSPIKQLNGEKHQIMSNAQKRRSHELSFSDAPSNESLYTHTLSETMEISPPKRQRVDYLETSLLRNAPTNASAPRVKTWTQTQPKKFKLAQTLALMKKPATPRKLRAEPRVKLYDSDLYLQTYINPDPFAATTTADPFLASTMYLDEQAVDRHQVDFKKWLNALVSIPEDLDADCNSKIDVGKLFNEVRHKEIVVAPTKEQQSDNYLTTFRLESLRRAAVELFFSEEMRLPCSKVAVYVNKQALRIRSDRNLHLDVVMQRTILELLLCFNPLWLRLGLEVVFGEKIHLQSNRDVVGLSTFILNRLFRNKFEEQKFSKAYTLTEEYAETIKKHSLQKILFLFLFLDKAKQKRIVKHNPCLFVKKSPHKETREVLLRFASELLGSIGDITRELRRLGYVLVHKQTFLDEFDYAFNNLAVDLRDGVRLTRVLEIILLRDDLTKQLRVPAISRLQRIFNVKLALTALGAADFQLSGDITPADIVDGHREKTLSLLWQIIYKFRSPKFHAAAKVLQQWWRRRWLFVVIQRRIRLKEQQRQERAATLIQSVFRGHQMRKYTKIYRAERVQAAIVLQKNTRRFLAQKQLFLSYHHIVLVQRRWRALRQGKAYRRYFLQLRESVIFLQRIWRRRIFAGKLLVAAATARLQRDQKQQAAAAHIQMRWKAYCKGKAQRLIYQQQRQLIIGVQQRLRAKWQMKKQRNEFLLLKNASMLLQQRYRARLDMLRNRKQYMETRQCLIQLQRRWRAIRLMRHHHKYYQQLQYNVRQLQDKYRARRDMRVQRQNYVQLRNAAVILQRKWRNLQLGRQKRIEFVHLRESTLVIQRRFRAYKTMRFLRAKYRGTMAAVQCLQLHWRGYLLMKRQRSSYLQLRETTIWLQRSYRQMRLMVEQRCSYIKLRLSVINVQQRWRAKLLMRQQRQNYREQVQVIISIQRLYRGKLAMRSERANYQKQRQAVIRLQCWYRGLLQMRGIRLDYQTQLSGAILLQRKWRATLEMRVQRQIFLQTIEKVNLLQRAVLAMISMRRQREEYQRLRNAALVIQRSFRARQAMLQERAHYQQLRMLALNLQSKYRARRLMRQAREYYIKLRHLTIHLQQKFRGHRLMQLERDNFKLLRRSIGDFQARCRGFLARKRYQALMTPEMMQFLAEKRAAKLIQRYWRGYRTRKRQRHLGLMAIRKRLIQLRQESKAMDSVRSKVQEAVRFLRGRFVASDALAILSRLDRLSRTVPHLLMWCSEFMATFCYGIMAQAIRSEVDKQLIERCSRIILNLARYNSTTVATFQESGLVTIAQMLLRWCDKDSEIFNTLCTLIWVFSHCPKKRQIIHDYMTTTDAIYMVRETKKLVARKEKMKLNARKPPMAFGRFSQQPQQQFSSRALPSLEPDFGIIRNKPYTFISSAYALDTILCKLDINLY